MFPDDSGDRKSGHATACVSRQYLGSRGQPGIRALVADRFHRPSESPHFIAELVRAATPYVAAVEPRKNCPPPPSDMAGIVSLYELRGWTEQDDKPVRHELGWADFQVRSGQAIQREPPHRVRPTLQRPQRPRGHPLPACTTPPEP